MKGKLKQMKGCHEHQGKLKQMKGCHEHQLPSYLDKFMWRERYGRTAGMAWQNILQDIATQYPV